MPRPPPSSDPRPGPPETPSAWLPPMPCSWQLSHSPSATEAAPPPWWFLAWSLPRSCRHLRGVRPAAQRQCGHVVSLRTALRELLDGRPQCIENTIGLLRRALAKFIQEPFGPKLLIPFKDLRKPVCIKEQSRPRPKPAFFARVAHPRQESQRRPRGIKLMRHRARLHKEAGIVPRVH